MPIDTQKRAETARKNGAKSNGPNTAEGRDRCRQAARDAARRRAVAVSFDCTLLPTESRELLDAAMSGELAYWQPSSPNEMQLVQELIDINWKIKRIRFAQNHALLSNMESQRQRAAAPELSAGLIAQAVSEGYIPGGEQLLHDRAINLLSANRTRLLRDLERLQRRFPNRAGSQPVLTTQHLSAEFASRVPAAPDSPSLQYASHPESVLTEPAPQPTPAVPAPHLNPGILEWAKTNFDFHADPHQADLMTTQSRDVLLLGGRQTGKSTAAAIRVVFEAVHHDESTILLAGPTGRQSGQIMTKSRQIAKRLALTLGAPPPGCDGFKLPNGSNIISLPDSEATIRGFSAPRLIIVDEAAFASAELFSALKPMLAVSGGRMMLLSTPNGQSGYFYEKWHEQNGPWHKILCKASDCARISQETLDAMRLTLSSDEYDQEFNCEFTAAPSQHITRELVRRNTHDDIKPLFEDEDEA